MVDDGGEATSGASGEEPVELVPEDDVAETPEGAPTAAREPSAHFKQLVARAEASGHKVQVLAPDNFGHEVHARIEFKTPHGSTRRLIIDEDSAPAFEAIDFSRIQLLERYDGYHVPGEALIECSVRVISARRLDAVPTADPGDNQTPATIRVAQNNVTLTLGASSTTGALLSGRFGRTGLSLTISNIDLADESADDALERLADAFFFDLDLRYGVHVALTRVRPRPYRIARRRRPVDLPPCFPSSSYPHEPKTLFRSAREMRSTPLIRFWSYYQVLEFFFPRYSLASAIRSAGQLLRDPRFDPHNGDDVSRLVGSISDTSGRNRNSEDRDLRVTVEDLVDEAEMAEFIEQAFLAEILNDKNSEISDRRVNLKSGDPVRSAVAARIYDIRCRIVHSKADGGGYGTGLLPGTHHEDLVLQELPLIEFLAERALVASASRLDVRAKFLKLS